MSTKPISNFPNYEITDDIKQVDMDENMLSNNEILIA